MWQNMPYGYMDGSWVHGGWLGLGMHGLFWLLLAAVFAMIVIWAMRAASRHHAAAPGSDAREILDGRYARGEIDREDYLARKRDLKARG